MQMTQEEPERLQFERTDKGNSLNKSSLDPYAEAYRLGDQALHARMRNFNDDWPERYKKEYIQKVICIVELSANRSNLIHEDSKELITGLTESKIEDYDDASWAIIQRQSLSHHPMTN